MTMLASPPLAVDPDEVPKLDGLFELVDEQLIEKQTSYLAGATSVKIAILLGGFVQANHLGALVSEVTFRCFPNTPKQVRRPDLAFIAAAQLQEVPEEGNVPIAPDLAIEIVSPGDSIYEMDDKLIDYKAAGIPVVWIVNPQARTVRIFRPGKPIDELTEADQLTGDAVLPGFAVTVSEMFPAAPAQST